MGEVVISIKPPKSGRGFWWSVRHIDRHRLGHEQTLERAQAKAEFHASRITDDGASVSPLTVANAMAPLRRASRGLFGEGLCLTCKALQPATIHGECLTCHRLSNEDR
jgi:hypothetical protein